MCIKIILREIEFLRIRDTKQISSNYGNTVKYLQGIYSMGVFLDRYSKLLYQTFTHYATRDHLLETVKTLANEI